MCYGSGWSGGFGRGRHVPGSELAADLLRKSTSAAAPWEKFYKFMGLVDGASEKEEHFERGSFAALTGTVLKFCHLSNIKRLATTLSITALVAWVAHRMKSERNAMQAQAIEKRRLRKNELYAKVEEPALATEVGDHEPDRQKLK